ncbi:MAG: hypothetical protein KAU16_07620 [Methanophagales archaeon]|nr:hypothetical protein [Methanophagales archaeon]
MEALIQGDIIDFIPFFNVKVEEGNLLINEDGDLSLIVDTGFNGGIALPEEVLEEMGLELAGYDTFRLATGEVVELPMFLGKVIIKDFEVETWFIPGDWLLGMEFLYVAGRQLSLNFEDDTVKLRQ